MDSPHESDLFFQSCGRRAGLTLEVERQGQRGAEPHPLELPFALLGRDERNQVCLADADVSRRHAYLQVLAGAVYCVDLASRTGVRWDGEPRLAGWVTAEGTLQIGPFFLRLSEATPPAPTPVEGRAPCDPMAADSPDAPPAPAWSLELPGGMRWRINRGLTLVGRSSRCKLRPNTHGASQFHCSLVRTDEGLWVVDLLSRRGTHVNGQRVAWSRLEEGDELRVGRVVLRLRGEASPAGGVSVALGEGAGAAYLSPPPDAPEEEEEGTAGPTSEELPAADFPLLPRPPGAGPMLPQVSSPGPLSEALLTPVINQFNLMQQQMLEQFHQTMVMMAQMFGNIHRDQMSLIREELNQLHRVTQELQALHVELAARGPAGAEAAAPSPPAREKSREEPAPAPRPAPEPAASPPPAPAPTAQRPPDRPAAGPVPTPESIHALLHQRLAALEQERKTRWERVLQFMLGR
jgi:pSer/pThr/pTyr-binding forkhead associated (FHA) protein